MKPYVKPVAECLKIEAKEAFAVYPGRCLWDTFYAAVPNANPVCDASTDVDRLDGDCYYGPVA